VATRWLCMLFETHIVASDLKILISVGTTVSVVVADAKYGSMSSSVPTVNTTCTHTTSTDNPIVSRVDIILDF
jgi:hypothetical protein